MPSRSPDHRVRHTRSTLLVPVVVLILTLGAIACVWTLAGRASSSRGAELRVSSIALALADLQVAPFGADSLSGGSPAASMVRIQRDEHAISSGLTVRAQPGVSPRLLRSARADCHGVGSVVAMVYATAVGKGGLVVAGPSVVLALQRLMLARGQAATEVLNMISHTDAARVASAQTQTELGAAVAMVLLMAAFAFFYLRSTAPDEAVGRLVPGTEALLGASEASTDSLALKVADDRLYANMASRSSTSRQVTDALLQVVIEQNVSLDEHVERVAEMAGVLAAALGESTGEVERIRLAAKLHDIGKVAIPAAVLDKPGPLEDGEWAFIHRHPVIGARIVSAAPALASTAPLINSSHERVDGQGYPDGLKGENIPFGSRIIAVCDAFEAMTCDRPYHRGVGIDEALAELTRRAGSHFDAAVVEAFCRTAVLHPWAPSAAAVPTGLVSAGWSSFKAGSVEPPYAALEVADAPGARIRRVGGDGC